MLSPWTPPEGEGFNGTLRIVPGIQCQSWGGSVSEFRFFWTNTSTTHYSRHYSHTLVPFVCLPLSTEILCSSEAEQCRMKGWQYPGEYLIRWSRASPCVPQKNTPNQLKLIQSESSGSSFPLATLWTATDSNYPTGTIPALITAALKTFWVKQQDRQQYKTIHLL